MNTPAQDFPQPFNRRVWVINHWDKDYTEKFRGEPVTIPGKGQKKVVMGYVEARRFLGQSKEPAQYMDGPHGRVLHPDSAPPKMLEVVEMTPEEIQKTLGLTKADLVAEAKEEMKSVRFACSACDKNYPTEKGLKIHMTTQHSGMEPIEK